MKKKITVVILPFILFAACLIASRLFLNISESLHYVCPSYMITGILCPGCGATRALASLLKLDFVSSLRNNPIIIIMCISLLVWYLQLLMKTFGINKKIIPESKVFYITAAGIIIIYFVIRNFVPVLQPLG